MVKLFPKNSILCDHNSPTLQTDRQTDRQTDGQTDRQTTCDRNTALCTKVHRAVKTSQMRHDGAAIESYSLQCNVNETEVSTAVSENWVTCNIDMSVLMWCLFQGYCTENIRMHMYNFDRLHSILRSRTRYEPVHLCNDALGVCVLALLLAST